MVHVNQESHDQAVLCDLETSLDPSAKDALIGEREDYVLDDLDKDDERVDYDRASFLLNQYICLQA